MRIPAKSLNIEIPLTLSPKINLVRPVLDISSLGLAFYMRHEDGYFNEGHLIKDFRVFNPIYEDCFREAEVIYCKAYERKDRKQDYHIGIKFLQTTHSIQRRPTRFKKEILADLPSRVHFTTFSKDRFEGKLKNFSTTGISLSIPICDLSLKKSEVLNNIHIYITESLVYRGDGVIVDIIETQDASEIKVYLKRNSISIAEVLSIIKNRNLSLACTGLEKSIDISEVVPIKFKMCVSETRHLLESIKKTLDQFENSILQYDPETQEDLSQGILLKLNRRWTSSLNNCFKRIHFLVENKEKGILQKYGEYYRLHLHPLLFRVSIY